MNYTEARAYMKEVSNLGNKPGLETIRELLRRLGNPQKNLKFIHVAGTNGKGSTCAYIANTLMQAGYKVGRYMSPVVREYEECIQSSDQGKKWCFISQEQVAAHMTVIRKAAEEMVEDGLPMPTIAEMETAMSMLEFVAQACEIVVLETLMGGRLDATNVVNTVVVSVFTAIGMDHMEYLGDTLEKIATEKAGIIKNSVPVVMDPYSNETVEVIEKYARERNTFVTKMEPSLIERISPTGEKMIFSYKGQGPYELELTGEHQIRNACVAIECIHVLRQLGYIIPEEAVRRGLSTTTLFGRFTLLKVQPDLVVDGAHNPMAAGILRDALLDRYGQKKGIFIMGVFGDKEYKEILSIMGDRAKCLIAISAPGPRGLPSGRLAKEANDYCSHVIDGGTLEQALQTAGNIAGKEDYILCFGSLSYLGQIPSLVERMSYWK